MWMVRPMGGLGSHMVGLTQLHVLKLYTLGWNQLAPRGGTLLRTLQGLHVGGVPRPPTCKRLIACLGG